MTYRLDRENPYEQQMTATVKARLLWEQKPALILDRSLFYPTSGGQSADLGRLWPTEDESDFVEVVDVVAHEGEVVHVLSKPLSEKASTLGGRIEWRRRFDHMQQHTGQHILSAALHQLLQAATKSSRLGAELDTIDLDKECSIQALQEAEDLANQILTENRGVKVSYPTPAELSQMKLRREPKVEDNIRIVEVDGFDLSPCGGTHVRSASEIGLICVTASERYKGGTRLFFLCGRRVATAFQSRRSEGEQLTKLLSSPVGEHAKAVERVLAESDARKTRLQELTEALAIYRANDLLREPEKILKRKLEIDKAQLRLIAQHISKQEGRAAFLGAIEEENGAKRGVLCFAAGPNSGVDAGKRLKEVCAASGGRGGGKPHLAEGSCPPEKLEAAIQSA